MATLITCPACKIEVSTEAAACPRCGHAFKKAGFNIKDPVHLVGLVLCVLVLAGIAYAFVAVAMD
jgi:uncharacterized paraquat-inducible protein A